MHNIVHKSGAQHCSQGATQHYSQGVVQHCSQTQYCSQCAAIHC